MNMIILPIVFVLLFSQTALSREVVCKITHETCYDRCFDPTQFECAGGRKICNKGQLFCNWRCSDPMDCEISSEEQMNTCPIGQLLCQNICYDPTTHKCTESGTICTKGQLVCGDDCYLPDEQVCLEGPRSQKFLCKIGEEICGYECYDPRDGTYSCSMEGKTPLLCQTGEKGCGYECYNPDSGVKCYGGHTLCQLGEENCDDECYDPLTETCFNNTKVCLKNREPCGQYMCYWPQNETCYLEEEITEGYGTIACPKNQIPCGYSCYDPTQSACLKYGRENRAVCPLESEICDGTCHSPVDTEMKCVDDILCKHDEDACGRECYNPNDPDIKSRGMTCQNGEVLCERGYKGCGNVCYDPKTEKCVQLKRARSRNQPTFEN